MQSTNHRALSGLPSLVSIVMPSFNQAAFITESIRSVLDQDYPNIELIVADGGSTDGTQEILARHQSLDSRLRWFSGPDEGPADALNKALRQVRGSLIGWLNSDDLYLPGAVSRAADELSSPSNLLMVYGHGQHVGEKGEFIEGYPTQRPDVGAERFRDGCFICQPTVFFKRSLWLLLGPLDTSLKTAFDFDYWLRAFLAFPGRIGFIEAVQASSRLHENCITMRMRRTVALDGISVVSRHLGNPPGHWLLTYAEELLRMPLEERPDANLLRHLELTLSQVSHCFSKQELESLSRTLRADPRLQEQNKIDPAT